MHKDKNNIFTHFKIQYKKEIIFFYKICNNFPYLDETFKNLEVFNPKEFHLKEPISNLTKKDTTITINYLFKSIGLRTLIIFYIMSPIIFNFLINKI